MTDNSHQCHNCRHFDLDLGSPGYSEYTPGDAAHLECLKGHYDLHMGDNYRDVQNALASGPTCPDWEAQAE